MTKASCFYPSYFMLVKLLVDTESLFSGGFGIKKKGGEGDFRHHLKKNKQDSGLQPGHLHPRLLQVLHLQNNNTSLRLQYPSSWHAKGANPLHYLPRTFSALDSTDKI